MTTKNWFKKSQINSANKGSLNDVCSQRNLNSSFYCPDI